MLNGMIVDNDCIFDDEMLIIKVDMFCFVDWGYVIQLSFGVCWLDCEKDNDVVIWWQGVIDSFVSGYGSSYVLGGGFVLFDLYIINNW